MQIGTMSRMERARTTLKNGGGIGVAVLAFFSKFQCISFLAKQLAKNHLELRTTEDGQCYMVSMLSEEDTSAIRAIFTRDKISKQKGLYCDEDGIRLCFWSWGGDDGISFNSLIKEGILIPWSELRKGPNVNGSEVDNIAEAAEFGKNFVVHFPTNLEGNWDARGTLRKDTSPNAPEFQPTEQRPKFFQMFL